MKRDGIRDWIIKSFKPVDLTVEADTIDQQIDLAIDTWNTKSGYKIVRMFPQTGMIPNNAVAGGAVEAQLQLSAEIKSVVKVFPSVMAEELFSNHPMWVLLGFITLDRYTSDLMLLSQTFEGYKIYLGNDFRWKFIRSDDSTKGGWLYLQQVPRGTAKVAVIGTKRILAEEDIVDEFILTWIKKFSRSLVKALEGNVLRHGQIIGIQNAGQEMVTESLTEQKDLLEELRKESRWMLMAQRR